VTGVCISLKKKINSTEGGCPTGEEKRGRERGKASRKESVSVARMHLTGLKKKEKGRSISGKMAALREDDDRGGLQGGELFGGRRENRVLTERPRPLAGAEKRKVGTSKGMEKRGERSADVLRVPRITGAEKGRLKNPRPKNTKKTPRRNPEKGSARERRGKREFGGARAWPRRRKSPLRTCKTEKTGEKKGPALAGKRHPLLQRRRRDASPSQKANHKDKTKKKGRYLLTPHDSP